MLEGLKQIFYLCSCNILNVTSLNKFYSFYKSDMDLNYSIIGQFQHKK